MIVTIWRGSYYTVNTRQEFGIKTRSKRISRTFFGCAFVASSSKFHLLLKPTMTIPAHQCYFVILPFLNTAHICTYLNDLLWYLCPSSHLRCKLLECRRYKVDYFYLGYLYSIKSPKLRISKYWTIVPRGNISEVLSDLPEATPLIGMRVVSLPSGHLCMKI